MPAPKKINYSIIEPHWRAGIKSPTELAAEYSQLTGVEITRVALIRYFQRKGIPRSLAGQIREKADEMVAAMVTPTKVTKPSNGGMVTPRTDEEIVHDNATAVATIRMAHRADIRRARSILAKAMEDLEESEDDVKTRIACVKAAAEALRTVVALEREAWGMQAEEPPAPEEPETDPVEVARRIAFLLASADNAMRAIPH